MTQQPTILGFYAHPDDEILGPGGTLAKMAAAGAHIEWIVATRGEAGEIAPDTDATPETLPQVREREMGCSAETLGFQAVHFLGYRDSGMRDTEDNHHPDAFMNSRADAVVPVLVRHIRRLRPHVALTFEPWGGYGHPDHITIHRHTHAALAAAADPTYRPDLGDAWDVPRLFYPLLRLATFWEIKARMEARNLDTGFFDRMQERVKQGWPDDNYHCVVDVRDTFRKKWTAFHCHATQFGPDNLFRQLPETEMAQIFTHEYFALVRPKPEPGLLLNSLVTGLNLTKT